jgi:diamine N-acetyltransferase
MTLITLREITRENWREALQLAVHPDQQRFVADYAPIVLVALAKAYVSPLGLVWLPYAIYAGHEMIGLLELAIEPDSTDQYWIYHFFIDQRYQGQGYGKQALAALIEHIERNYPECRSISLTVQPENLPAQRLYTAAGFIRTNEEAFGEPLFRLSL